MGKYKRGLTILGVVLLIIVLVLLLSSPGMIFSPTVTFIDTELYSSSGNEVPVRTKADLGDPEYMAAFPRIIGKWEGYDYDTTKYVELLGADLMILRGYEPSTFSQPVFFLILQADTESSFHPPEVCARAQGGEIQERGEEEIVITNTSWVKEDTVITIPLKKLVVTKSSESGEITERRILLYCYVKGNQFYTDMITMIQVEALAPLTGSYEGSLKEEKEFLAEAIPHLFNPGEEAESRLLFMVLVDWGIIGYIIITVLCVIPVALIIFARTLKETIV
jgi:hypothetical protein